MREIRYRAWQKSTDYLPDNPGTMWQPGELLGEDLIVTFNGNVMEKYQDSGFGETWESYRDVSDSYVLMQYTGLLDKNGVEIYEGDIIKYAYRDYTVVVKPLERGRYSAFWDFSDFLDPSDNELGAEVIGNIYENPELLEDKK